MWDGVRAAPRPLLPPPAEDLQPPLRHTTPPEPSPPGRHPYRVDHRNRGEQEDPGLTPSSLGRITVRPTNQAIQMLAAAAADAELLLEVDRQALLELLMLMLVVILGIESRVRVLVPAMGAPTLVDGVRQRVRVRLRQPGVCALDLDVTVAAIAWPAQSV